MNLKIRVGLFLVLAIAFINKSTFAYDSVKINGLFRYSDDVVKENLKFKNKKNITSEDLSAELKNLYNLGFFSDVNLNYLNNVLTINVVEVPVIADVKFNGLKKINKELLLPELLTFSRGFYSKANAIEDAKKIEASYKSIGILDASVVPMIEFLEGGKVYVIFDVNEGKVRKINKIFINGNKQFSDYTIKEKLEIKEDKLIRFFSSSKKYNVTAAISSIERLPLFYQQKGFLNAKVDYQIVTINDDNTVDINVYVKEGEKFKFGSYRVVNNLPEFKIEDEKSLIKFKPNKIFNINLVTLTQYQISALLKQSGFAFSNVAVTYEQNVEDKTVDVVFTINPSQRIFVNKISIRGNLKTNDNVIRREFTFVEGDIYNPIDVQRSIQKIRNTGYFSSVDIKEERVGEDRVNLIVDVAEGRTVSGNVQFGYDFASSFSVALSWQESNFKGTGVATSASVEKGRFNEGVNFSIYNPYFLGKDLGFNSSTGYFNDYNTRIQDYTSRSFYQAFSFNYSITKRLRQSFSYEIRYDMLKIETESTIASPLLLERDGRYITSKVGQSLTYSIREKGFSVSLAQYVAGVGGNVAFFQNDFRIEQSFPLFGIDNSFLNLKLKVSNIIGIGGKSVKIRNRFSLGPNSGLRGFDFEGVAPVLFYRSSSLLPWQNTSYGGKNLIAGSIEYTFPNFIPRELGLRTFVFLDFGTVFGYDKIEDSSFKGEYLLKQSTNLRASIGVGASISTPVGEIAILYANAIKYESFDKRKSLFIGIGGNYF